MNSKPKSAARGSAGQARPHLYRIGVSGLVETEWARGVCGMEATASSEERSELVGRVQDQSALLGVLRQLRDRGHEVLWLTREQASQLHPGASSSAVGGKLKVELG